MVEKMTEEQLKKMAKSVFEKVYNEVQNYASDVPPIHFDYDPGTVTSFVPSPGGLIITQARHENGGKVVEVLLTQELIDILDEVVCRHNKTWRPEEEDSPRSTQVEGIEDDDLATLMRDN